MHITAGTRVALKARFEAGDGTVFEDGSEGCVEYGTDEGRLIKIRMNTDSRSIFVPSNFPLTEIQSDTNMFKLFKFREGAD